jgi:hypothetical protein
VRLQPKTATAASDHDYNFIYSYLEINSKLTKDGVEGQDLRKQA